MSIKTTSGRPETPHPDISDKEIIDTLAFAQERLADLNGDLSTESADNNKKLSTDPYESAVFFNIDTRPSNRASALVHTPSYNLPSEEYWQRLEFLNDTIVGKRIILSRSALNDSLIDARKKHEQEFHDSLMNPGKQIVFAYPIVHEDAAIAAIQLAFTVNDDKFKHWALPSNKQLDTIWEKHRSSMAEVGSVLAILAMKTSSLSNSFEIQPPDVFDAIVIGWDVVNSRAEVRNGNYSKLVKYLERWKAARTEITKHLGAIALDRGDAEYIILPFNHVDTNNPGAIERYSKRNITPIIETLVNRHEEIAELSLPNMLKKVKFAVGIGNFEEDQDGNLSSKALYELKDLADGSAKSIVYSPAAEKMLF